MDNNKCGLIVALDLPSLDGARDFLDRLDKATKYVKVGPRLYALGGVAFAKEIIDRGYELFLDLKLHDIPNTVGRATLACANHRRWWPRERGRRSSRRTRRSPRPLWRRLWRAVWLTTLFCPPRAKNAAWIPRWPPIVYARPLDVTRDV